MNTTHFAFLRPTSVAFIAPSVTTYGGVNPGYRVYTLDDQSFELIDHETYFVNLTEANANGDRRKLTTELGYRAREDLGLSSLHPSQFHVLIIRLLRDNALFRKFEKIYYNQSSQFQGCRSHDWVCKADVVCRLVSAKSHDYSLCRKLIRDFSLL